MQRPTGAPLPPLGSYRDKSRTQPDQGETSHSSTSHRSPSSFSSISHHSPIQHVTTRKRILRDFEDSYPNKRTPLPRHAKPMPLTTTNDQAKETVQDDGSIYHLNALMTTKMMTEEMREQILDIIESQYRSCAWLIQFQGANKARAAWIYRWKQTADPDVYGSTSSTRRLKET
jgi:hypothetical protein